MIIVIIIIAIIIMIMKEMIYRFLDACARE